MGKTEIARRLAKIVKAPFLKVEATKYTEVGYVGRDVESMIRDLVEVAIRLVKDERYKEVESRAFAAAVNRVADLLSKKSEELPQGVTKATLVDETVQAQPRLSSTWKFRWRTCPSPSNCRRAEAAER